MLLTVLMIRALYNLNMEMSLGYSQSNPWLWFIGPRQLRRDSSLSRSLPLRDAKQECVKCMKLPDQLFQL